MVFMFTTDGKWKRGVIKTVAAEAGSTLKVDDVIVEFEDEDE